MFTITGLAAIAAVMLGLVSIRLAINFWMNPALTTSGTDFVTEFTTVKVHLFNTPLVYDRTTPIATFAAAEATFGGYAAVAVAAPQPPYFTPAGGVTITLSTIQWSFTVAPADTIYGYYITDTTSATLLVAGNFASPIVLGAIGDAIQMEILLNRQADNVIEAVVNGVPQ